MAALETHELSQVRVLIVDDAEDIRMLLRLQFARDPRFVVVGEAADGFAAIRMAENEQPDLIVLDRQMPGLSGMDAIPEIRRRAPESAIILYTANADPVASQAALDAGAIAVLQKAGIGFVERLVDTLLSRAATSDATIEIKVGPVSAKAARVWIANTTKVVDAVAAHPEVLTDPIPEDVMELFRSFLNQWNVVAQSTDEFRWVARASLDDASRVVGYWAVIDAMTDDQLARLGIQWAPPEAEPFFASLTAGVLDALRLHESTQRLAARVGAQWAAYERNSAAPGA